MAASGERKAALKQEVEHLIGDYRLDAAEKPPFTIEELITVVAVCSDAEWLGEEEIYRAIFDTFPFYASLAVEVCIKNTLSTNGRYYGGSGSPLEALPGFRKALVSTELPLIIEEQAKNTSPQGPRRASTWLYRVDTAASRIYLRHWLEPERKGTFDFLGLPPELRNEVYELVLVLPRSDLALLGGKHFRMTGRDCATTRVLRDKSVPATGRYWDLPLDIYRYLLPSIKGRLELLATCKQIFAEAVAMFYRQHHFSFVLPYSTPIFGELALPRVKYLSTLKIELQSDRESSLRDLAPLLNRITQLERLELDMESDRHWMNMHHYERQQLGSSRNRPFTNYDQIPNFPEIAAAAARAQELVITGDCPKARSYFEAAAAKHKKQVEKQEKEEEKMQESKSKSKAVRTKTVKAPAKTAPMPSISTRRTRQQTASAREA